MYTVKNSSNKFIGRFFILSNMTEVTEHAGMHWRRKWQPTPVFLPGESQGWRSLVGCRLWGRTESDTTERVSSSSSSMCITCITQTTYKWKDTFLP